MNTFRHFSEIYIVFHEKTVFTQRYSVAIVSYYDDFDKAYEGDDDDKLTTTPTFNNQELPVYGPKITKKVTYESSGHAVENSNWPTDGFRFTIEAGTYKITEKNSAIEGFVAKPWRFDRYESWRHFNKGRR